MTESTPQPSSSNVVELKSYMSQPAPETRMSDDAPLPLPARPTTIFQRIIAGFAECARSFGGPL